MAKAPTDYFSLKPVRGSSPTASLAADLSQNFHIDQSPQLPTPRRSLFSSNLLGTLNGRGGASTPPLPSSSPGPANDSMEISPLPHKAPFFVTTHVEPTPLTSPMEEVTSTLIEDAMQESPTEPPKQPERRRPSLMRPSFSRTKGLTTTSISLKSARSECTPFKFGNGASAPSFPLMSTEERLTSSPQGDARPHSAHSPAPLPMGPPRFKQPSSGLGGHLRSVGSPIVGHVRKPSNPLQRPRKQFRRSLSMFEHPGDVMKQEKAILSAACLDSIMDIDDPPRLRLPHFNSDEETLPRITKATMVDVLDGKYGRCYDQSIIIDCRFEYEYEGGHIEGAINVNDKERLATQLFESPPPENTLLIFHCEYSAHRAPIMAKFLRHKDRACNAHQYPKLTYPEVYILDGGYSSFFMDHKLRCYPQNYVEMGAQEHANACERGLGRIKQQRAKLSRAQTFAFGQHEQQVDDSPTASSRQSDSLITRIDIAVDAETFSRRMQSRRMVSF
ncbi:cell division cycle- protein [Imshaugia aleurites]|uniref:M-phase inducer phosphatase n=1 Tax=Imshaugia aleurites TaxID=172621 RepID=A0A8H3FUF5_9LECA|nr:cell division cycle- protein [Imshaugia aleurites]